MPNLFQLAARSICNGNRCLPAELVSDTGYANPPWSMIGLVLSQVQAQQACIVLVAPVWKEQPWYPLLHMLIALPYVIRHGQCWDPLSLFPQPVVWHISGRDTETRSFRRKLPHCCSNPGELRPIDHTTHSSGSGFAGVIQGIQIPFLVL